MSTGSPSLERDARALAVSLEKHRYLVLMVLTVFYALGAIAHSRAKPIWYDEMFTVIPASAPDVAATWKLALHIDNAPPLPHLLTHFAMRWFGGSDVAIRLPAIAGFWVFCLSLFWFVRLRLGIFYGLAALLLPFATQTYDYSYEARPYGIELAFCGLMLVSWQAATSSGSPREKFRHSAACAALSLSLMGAVLCHYYAVMLYVPLAGAEAWRWRKTRRIDGPIWAALALGAAPLVWCMAGIREAVQAFTQRSFSPANPAQVLDFWENGLQPGLSVLALALAVMALWALKSPASSEPHDKPPATPPHELLASLLFLAIPVCVVAAGMLVTHVFSQRYAVLGLTAVPLLLPPIAARLSGGRALPAFLMLALCAVRLIVVTATLPSARNLLDEETILLKALERGPVVVADGQLFLPMWHYLPEPLKSNLIFLVDSAASVQYGVFNSANINGLAYTRRWVPLPVLDYRDFVTPGKEFLVLQNPLKPGWLLARIAADGGFESIQQYTNIRQLYRIRMQP